MLEDIERLEKEICLFLSTPFDYCVGRNNGSYHGNVIKMEFSRLLNKRRMSVTRAIQDFKDSHGNNKFKIETSVEKLIVYSSDNIRPKTLESIKQLTEEVIFKYNEICD